MCRDIKAYFILLLLDMASCPMIVEHVQSNKLQKLQNFQSLNLKHQNEHFVSDLDSGEQCTVDVGEPFLTSIVWSEGYILRKPSKTYIAKICLAKNL